MATKTKQSDIRGDFDKMDVLMVGGPHPYLWFGIDGVCVDTLDKAKLRKLAKLIARALAAAE